MLKENEDCIRYLMREMDPSEEIEFEREMMEDQNLLIEVESLRKTYQKLGNLPLKNPPEALIEKISTIAVTTQKQKIEDSNKWILYLTRSVASAAAVLMIATTGYFFYNANQVNSVEPVIQPTADTEYTVQPWVDRNEVIQFVGTSVQPTLTEGLQQQVDESFDKLKLVNSETGFGPSTRGIVLTSTGN
ncbi:MAG: hypothetical protein MI700_03740 [Balneolales bacterium]|nr:hypothetical protein [Balneolales bacterium]